MEYSWVLSEFVRGIPINQAVEWNDTWSWALLTMLTSGTTCGWVCSTPRRSTVFGWTLGRFNSSWRCTSLCHSAELPRANQRISLRMFKRKSAVHTQLSSPNACCAKDWPRHVPRAWWNLAVPWGIGSGRLGRWSFVGRERGASWKLQHGPNWLSFLSNRWKFLLQDYHSPRCPYRYMVNTRLTSTTFLEPKVVCWWRICH